VAITSITTQRIGQTTIVTAVSGLSGTVYFHWYLDGAYVGVSQAGTRAFAVPSGEQARIEVIDTLDPDFDPLAAAPAAFPARYTIHWIRSLAADVREYQINQNDGVTNSEIARVPHDDAAWDYTFITPRLDDLTTYTFQVVPMDAAGNAATVIPLLQELVVRVPDAPDFTAVRDVGTQKITFAAAA